MSKNFACEKGSKSSDERITYDKLFWLFIFGSIAGVLIEGGYCLAATGKWETHVVSVIGPFNILYGAGAVLFFAGARILKKCHIAVKVIILIFAATLLELLCGILLRNVLGMKAWDYTGYFMNYKGLICAEFSLAWGVAALVVCLFHSKINAFLGKFKGRGWHIACVIFSLFMVVNIALTGALMIRWSERHYGKKSQGAFDSTLDGFASDEYMQNRFVEWKFIDKEK